MTIPSSTSGAHYLTTTQRLANASHDVEMQPQGPLSHVGRVQPGTPQALEGLKQKMADIFEPHKTEANEDALKTLINNRADELHAMGQTADDVERLLDKAARMDRVAVPAQGAVGGIPFGVASVVLDRVPDISADAAHSPAYGGFLSGAFSGAADVVGGGLLSKATHDTFWLKAPAEELEPVMQDAQKAKASENLGTQTLQNAVATQTFSLRNAVRGVLNTTLTATSGPKTAAAVDTGMSALGGMAAGAGFASIMRGHDTRAHRAGPEYLFGRQDWKKQYETLKDCNPTRDPLINGAKRMAKLPLDVMTDGLKAIAGAATMTSLANNGLALGGGFAVASQVRGLVKEAATRAGFSPVAKVAVDQATNLGMSALAFAGLSVTSTLAGPASDHAVKVLQEDVPSKVASTAESAGKQISSGYAGAKQSVSSAMDGIGDAAASGADMLAGAINTLRRRPAATANATAPVNTPASTQTNAVASSSTNPNPSSQV
ncbi:hypothetical protein [Pseudomonas gingeri]|uniref:Type III effector n=1 Tax=Pseudomonas gingeri TaxID=117681 RepID=A0A7Y7Y9G5_9PSED|nr:hypothetical protein [Pseudomonas gingeri]NWB28833.1 hypothetical protein [Pseudomonas gingeri]NWC32293.1 hypothetical protein [Pseudomonas gingeri]NWD08559.1 hypothetical protein [Pseudomonas gingeri]NWD50291.1 hypothetical protein [Pseudomonas gingeri]NWE35149.1 hypothetical protein [Pseudomonas gingeri]